MNSSLVIRPFTPDDIDEVVHLVHRTIRICYPTCYPQAVVDFFIEYHRKEEILRKSKQGILSLAYIENSLVALGYLLENEVGGIYVSPVHQKKGIGKQLLNSLLKEALAKELDHVWLDATPIAKKMYLDAGFIVVEEKTDFVSGNVPLDYFLMRKEL